MSTMTSSDLGRRTRGIDEAFLLAESAETCRHSKSSSSKTCLAFSRSTLEENDVEVIGNVDVRLPATMTMKDLEH